MDEFGSKSFEKYFKPRDISDGYYSKTHFDVTGYSSNSYGDNPSTIARFANLLKKAVSTVGAGKKLQPMPKIIVIVPDNDIIKCFSTCDATSGCLTKPFGMVINFIMTEYERGTSSYKEGLPSKAKKDMYPYFLWILLPIHDKFSDNAERLKFNNSAEEMAKYHTNVKCLELKKVWDSHDGSLFSDEGRFTSEGYRKYWDAVDKTVRYCDSVVLKKKFTNKQSCKNATQEQKCQKDIYKWKNPKIRNDLNRFNSFRKLPSPPRRR